MLGNREIKKKKREREREFKTMPVICEKFSSS